MTNLRALLIGTLLGQLLMFPTLYSWINHPVVEVIPIPNDIFMQVPYRKFVMHKVPHRDGGKRDLTVVITSNAGVTKLLEAYEGDNNPSVLGFYNAKNHLIVSIDSPDVLVHEFRHVFEGPFHRGPTECKLQ